MKSFGSKARFCVLWLTAALAVTSNGQDVIAPSTVRLTAIVTKYRPNAMHDTFDDGFAFYDATDLKVVRPKKYAGNLVLYHGEPKRASSPWRRVGTMIRFRIDAKSLESKSTQNFAAAAEDLTVIAISPRNSVEQHAAEKQKPSQKKSGEKFMSREVIAFVVKYVPDAMHDTFDDGSTASYDATELRVLSPQDHLGKLQLFHSAPVDDSSAWKAVGSKIRFRIDESLLQSENEQIFADAVDGFEPIAEEGDGGDKGLGLRQRRQVPERMMQRRTRKDIDGHVRRTLPPRPNDEKQVEPTDVT